MRKIRTILFPFDGSEKCRQMAPAVRDWCLRHEASLIALNVLSMPVPLFLDVPPVAWTEDVENLRQESRSKMIETLSPIFHDVSATYIAETGNTAEIILKTASEEGADLIAMPTHGRGPFRKLLLGSVTSKVLHDTKCPVLTSAHAEEFHGGFQCTVVLSAIDFNSEAIPLLQEAAGIADLWGASLVAVHAVPQAEIRPEMYLEIDYVHHMIEGARERVAELVRESGVRADLCVQSGPIGLVIHDAATQYHAGLVVAGRGHLSEPFGRLRTHVHEIIRHSPAPVLSI